MVRRANMTDSEIDEQIQQILDDTGNLPSINQLMAVCPCGRVRIQQRLAHWREEEATKVIQVADIPGDVRNALMLALDRALSDVILRERQLAQEAYAGKWIAVQSDIEDTNKAYAELEKQCQLLRNENDRLSAELDTIQKSLLMKTGENQNLASQLAEMKAENDSMKGRLAVAEKEARELAELNKTLSTQNAEYLRNNHLTGREIDRLNAAREAAEERERKASQTAERAVAECAIAQEQVRALQADKALLESKLAAFESLKTDHVLAKDEILRLRGLLYGKKKGGDQGQQQQKQRPYARTQKFEIRQQGQQEGQAAPEQERQDQGKDAIPSQQQSEQHTTDTKISEHATGQDTDTIPTSENQQQEDHNGHGTETAEQPTPGKEEAETSDPAKVINHVSADVVVRKSPHSEE